MNLKSLLIKLCKQILIRIDKYAESKGLKSKARRAIIHLFSLISCFIAVTFFYLIIYLLFIPSVHQSTRLNIVRTEIGYTARILNFEHNFPTCKNQKMDDNNLTEAEKIQRKFVQTLLMSWIMI